MSVESARLAGVEGRPLRARRVVGSGMIGPLGARCGGANNILLHRSRTPSRRMFDRSDRIGSTATLMPGKRSRMRDRDT
jgi:hypothetical protein